jgi:hypothetical protein
MARPRRVTPVTDDDIARYIAARVIEDGDCLRWTGFRVNGHPAGAIGPLKFLVRREVWQAAHGEIPPGRILRCTCETPLCVNLEHLRCTTYQSVAKECGALGLMSGRVRSARIADVKRAGRQAKISQADAEVIRGSDAKGVELAEQFGISPSTVSKIRRGECRREFRANPFAGLIP